MDATNKPLTARTITDAQIEALRYEAGRAGDADMVAICRRALAGRGGKAECARVINETRAMEAE